MPQTVVTPSTADSPAVAPFSSSGLVEQVEGFHPQVEVFYPPFPIRHQMAARSPHFWAEFRPRTGSDPNGWSLVQYGTKRPTQEEGDVRGWAGAGYAVPFRAPEGLPRLFTVSACYHTGHLTASRGDAWLLLPRAFLNVRAPGFYREAYAAVQVGTRTLVSMDVRLEAGVTYTIHAGGVIEIGVRDFKPDHYFAYGAIAGSLRHIRVERFGWEPPDIDPQPFSRESVTDPGEGQEPPEGEVLEMTEVPSEEIGAATRQGLGLD
jgi:hypothetical protein